MARLYGRAPRGERCRAAIPPWTLENDYFRRRLKAHRHDSSLFIVASLPLLGQRSADAMAIILMPAILLLSLYQFGYQFGSDAYNEELGWIRSYGGFIAFPVAIASIVIYLVYRSTKLSKNAPDLSS
jgi:hypothetical protein